MTCQGLRVDPGHWALGPRVPRCCPAPRLCPTISPPFVAHHEFGYGVCGRARLPWPGRQCEGLVPPRDTCSHEEQHCAGIPGTAARERAFCSFAAGSPAGSCLMKAAPSPQPRGTGSGSLHFSPQGSAPCVCLPACLPACLRRSHARGWSPAHGEHAAARSEGERVFSQETRPTSKLRLAEQQGGSAQIGGEPGFLVRKTEGASGGGRR